MIASPPLLAGYLFVVAYLPNRSHPVHARHGMTSYFFAGQASGGAEAQVHRGGQRADIHGADDWVFLALPRPCADPAGLHAQGGHPIRGKLGAQEGKVHGISGSERGPRGCPLFVGSLFAWLARVHPSR